MSNSPLVNYTRISPNSNNPRKDKIRKITIHHMAGNLSVETCGNIFAASSRGASSNYGIGSDGRVGMYVEEKNRSWCSSSPSNDHQAITIEVANDGGAPNWHVSDTALNKLIELCVDICKRNGISQLNYTGDSSGNLTRHNMFTATTCPGPYLQSKFPYIASEVNKRLNGTVDPTPDPTPSDKFNIGDEVIVNGPLYVSSNASGSTGYVKNKRTRITRKAPGTAHPYNTTGDLGWMNESSIQAVNVPKPGPSGKFNIGDKVYSCKSYLRNLEIIKIEGIKIICKGEEYIKNRQNYEEGWHKKNDIILYSFEIRLEEFKNAKNYRVKNKWDKIIQRNQNMYMDLMHLYNQIMTKEMNLNPFYQRDLVWTNEQKKAYIEALFLEKAEIKPTIILNWENNDENCYEVLDGKQRISTILEFLNNKFPIFDNILFKDLSESDVKFITSKEVNYTRIEKLNNKNLTDEEKIELFLEINELGTKMSDEHIQKIKSMLK